MWRIKSISRNQDGYGIRIIGFLAILLVHLINPCQSVNRCCPENVLWQDGSNCTDGSKIQLECPNGIFILDPHENPVGDNFTIIDGELAIAEDLGRITEDRFCLTRGHSKGSTIAFVCFENAPSEWRQILFGTLCTCSALFLLATLTVYIILPELRDLQGKILMSAMTSLLFAYILLAIVQLDPEMSLENDHLCKGLAFTMYYCFMASFLWLHFVAFNLWRSSWFSKPLLKDQTWYMIFSVVAWGLAVAFLMGALIGHHTSGYILSPGFGEQSCWFAGSHETWVYFYGPVACLMTLNVIYFSLTCYELWHKYKDFSGTRLRILRFKCMLYLKLIWVMGITWIFEVISFATGSKWTHYWMITDALNSLQGLIIFLLLVATRKRVLKLLAKKRPLGLSFPKKWAAGYDEECEVVISEEEVELSQTG
ncbi:G-protein coupled receptor Mth2-like [Athalia rosae]|uniref:G-protein coupled receptor Mth2-like n=1 Tax=Athalia rosae TaxID=37344 RepID=UPI00203392C5|nr:G-protein coupled receptor Mth2-like [Athalia rosae]